MFQGLGPRDDARANRPRCKIQPTERSHSPNLGCRALRTDVETSPSSTHLARAVTVLPEHAACPCAAATQCISIGGRASGSALTCSRQHAPRAPPRRLRGLSGKAARNVCGLSAASQPQRRGAAAAAAAAAAPSPARTLPPPPVAAAAARRRCGGTYGMAQSRRQVRKQRRGSSDECLRGSFAPAPSGQLARRTRAPGRA